MQIYSKIDIGRVRSTNQDAFFAGELEGGAAFITVCDGMGGAKAGNIASETAVKLISEYTVKSYRDGMSSEQIEKLLKNAIVSANIEIYDAAMKSSELSGMGTTAVAAVIGKDGSTVIAHVGDSRAYLAGEEIKQITRDHSVVQSLIESGRLTPEQAKVHPRKNVITRALGVEEDVSPDCDEIRLKNGETLLVCTDGLTNFVDTADILKVFKTTEISGIAGALVEIANENGGGDNITVVTATF